MVVSATPAGRTPWWRRRWLYWVAGSLLVLSALAAYLLWPFWKLSSHFEEITFLQPSRLYAQPEEITVGHAFSAQRMVKDLAGEGYRESTDGGVALAPGRYRATDGGVAVHLRSFFLPDGNKGGGLLEIAFRGPRVARIWLNGQTQANAVLEPPLLASYYGPDQLERRPVRVDEVADDLIQSVIAAEDDTFYTHSGVSPTGILRALWVNLRGHQLRQGGSTLTQQVVKNIYLTQERKLARKIEEAVLAVMIETRYSKTEILNAYLNEIYLGRSGGVNVMGVGAASRAYFGKDASQLTLAEAATLAGIIPAPSAYSPLNHPERARERRDWVLHRLETLHKVDEARIAAALATPIVVSPEPLARRRAPYFADAMEGEAAARFQVSDLADGGYSLYSTLSWEDQQAAQVAVDAGLTAAEKGYEHGKESLQVALVSIAPQSGGILAYLGGRRYEQSQFDRVSQAHRQTGSSFKPVVYAAAFEEHKATPATFLEDEELEVEAGGQTWSPKNDDGDYHGWVSVRTALEHSYNPATARLALEVGLPQIVKLAHAMGITTTMPAYPAVALGSTAVAPIELATVYSSLAAGGVRPPVHGLNAVVDSRGKPVPGAQLPPPERVLSRESAYLVTSLMIGVIERGTGAGAAPALHGRLAGKTGTTNDRRDSWFGGFAPERATVVWVGHDDNSVTRLSGARAALPVWSRFMVAVTPPGGWSTFSQPEGIRSVLIDPESGLLATDSCPEVFTEVFRQGEQPTEICNLHQGLNSEQLGMSALGGEHGDDLALGAPAQRSEEPRPPTQSPFRRWLHRIFGGGKEPAAPPPAPAAPPRPPDPPP